MSGALIRKLRRLTSDAVLRRWLLARTLGRFAGVPPFKAHRPPYLNGRLPLMAEKADPPAAFAELTAGRPTAPLNIPMPGQTVKIEPGDEKDLFGKSFEDTETLLGLHRFAWLPLLGDTIDPAWVWAIWQAWRQAHGKPDSGWPWHPYTAAERAVNILNFAQRQGLPGPKEDTLEVLAAHGPAIADRLEYFGDHHTSNHLSNNGRGLYLLGLALGLEDCADMGAEILIEEGRRIFDASGILREGSSHYHLLLARNYAEAWLAALKYARREEPALKRAAAKALAAIPRLVLPGGLPLIGDISPDCPPGHLMGLIPGGDAERGWISLLDPADREAFVGLRDCAGIINAEDLRADGWLRADFGPWSGLWHAAPEGWSHMPGHGHQDCGGFELHYLDQPLFVDPGRGAYGETGEAAYFLSAQAHNSLTVDGADPYPDNKPYYDPAFRALVGGPPPELRLRTQGVSLNHHGFARLGGVGALSREWSFTDSSLMISDSISGTTERLIERRFHTPLAARPEGDSVVLEGGGAAFRMTGEGSVPSLRPVERWVAYGESVPATEIRFKSKTTLPWSAALRVEVL